MLRRFSVLLALLAIDVALASTAPAKPTAHRIAPKHFRGLRRALRRRQ